MVIESGYEVNSKKAMKKQKRRTIDPAELVMGVLYSLSKGVSLFKNYRCHETYIPKIPKLAKVGYLSFGSQLSLNTGIKKKLTSTHREGEKCIKEMVNYYNSMGWSGRKFRNLVKKFVVNDI